jgi:hypothetical protein
MVLALWPATLSITTFSIMPLTIKSLFLTLRVTNSQNSYVLHYPECPYAECLILFIVMLSVLMLNVIMLSVVASAGFVNSLFCQTKNKGKYDLPNPNVKDHLA